MTKDGSSACPPHTTFCCTKHKAKAGERREGSPLLFTGGGVGSSFQVEAAVLQLFMPRITQAATGSQDT